MQSNSAPDTPIRRSHIVAIALLAALAFLPSLFNQFALDDLIHLSNNVRIRSLDGALHAFAEPMYPGNLYRPAVTASYAATYALAGNSALPYHATNILAHACNAVLAYLLFCAAGLEAGAALLAAVFFAVNPLQSEAVANVSGRAELFAAFFGLSAVLLALKQSRRGGYKLGAMLPGALFFGALCSKESALMLFPALLLLLRLKSVTLRSAAAQVYGMGAALVLYLACRLAALHGMFGESSPIDPLDNALVSLGGTERILNAWTLLGRYVHLFFFPDRLSADYSWAVITPFTGMPGAEEILLTAALLLFLGLGIIAFRRGSACGFLALWFFVLFGVTANLLFPIGTIFGERLAYLPSIGLAGAAVGTLSVRIGALPARGFLWGMIPLFILSSLGHSRVWHDNYSLFEYQIGVSPQSSKTQVNYATTLRNKGNIAQARSHIEEALRIYPNNEDAFYLSGATDIAQNQLQSGETALKRALEINPRHTPALNLLGRSLLNRGEIDAAEKLFNTALESDRNSIEAQIGLFAVALNRGDMAKAAALEAAIASLDPANTELAVIKTKLRQSSTPPS